MEGPARSSKLGSVYFTEAGSTREHDEQVQTKSLFVDLRLPTTRLRFRDVCSVEDLSPPHDDTRLCCGNPPERSGKTSNASTSSSYHSHVCTRHHCIDWNFVGTPRNRPNKWWVETFGPNRWKEWAYATDQHGQHYYCEHWERLPNNNILGNVRPVVGLRRTSGDRDGVIAIVGDYFNCCFGRPGELIRDPSTSLVNMVDDAVEQGDLDLARHLLSLEGCHGVISRGWKVAAATNFWIEGQRLWKREEVKVEGNTVVWKDQHWEVFESNLSPKDLQAMLHC